MGRLILPFRNRASLTLIWLLLGTYFVSTWGKEIRIELDETLSVASRASIVNIGTMVFNNFRGLP